MMLLTAWLKTLTEGVKERGEEDKASLREEGDAALLVDNQEILVFGDYLKTVSSFGPWVRFSGQVSSCIQECYSTTIENKLL